MKLALLTLILLPLAAEENGPLCWSGKDDHGKDVFLPCAREKPPSATPITGERRLKIENNQLRQQLLQKEIEALQRQVEAVAKPLAEDLKALEEEACAWAKIPAPCKLDPQKMTVAAVEKPVEAKSGGGSGTISDVEFHREQSKANAKSAKN